MNCVVAQHKNTMQFWRSGAPTGFKGAAEHQAPECALDAVLLGIFYARMSVQMCM